jgi:hypothetical protein
MENDNELFEKPNIEPVCIEEKDGRKNCSSKFIQNNRRTERLLHKHIYYFNELVTIFGTLLTKLVKRWHNLCWILS